MLLAGGVFSDTVAVWCVQVIVAVVSVITLFRASCEANSAASDTVGGAGLAVVAHLLRHSDDHGATDNGVNT